MGLGAGYHLQLAGAAIAFLVRPARVLQMSRSQVLYSYDDATLKTFADYRLGDPPIPRPYRVVRAILSFLHKSQSRRSL
jgi:hypothetical protein